LSDIMQSSNKNKGYENLAGSKAGNVFSIEGHDDDED